MEMEMRGGERGDEDGGGEQKMMMESRKGHGDGR